MVLFSERKREKTASTRSASALAADIEEERASLVVPMLCVNEVSLVVSALVLWVEVIDQVAVVMNCEVKVITNRVEEAVELSARGDDAEELERKLN